MLPATLSIQRLMAGMKKTSASDLHVKPGKPPCYRIGGLLRALDMESLTADEADHLLAPIIPERLAAKLEHDGSLDFAVFDDHGDRFRVNVFHAGGHSHAAIRRVRAEIPDFTQLNLPPIYRKLAEETGEGLVLIVGVTGSGKSSTAAAMLQHINLTKSENIITVEDPVEYRFSLGKSFISQREIGIDVPDFPTALRAVVRQDPDIVFIGELRDQETILAAIQAAETGHLVFASMHSADAQNAFSRILEFFPISQHAFIRGALSLSLKAICAQRLLPADEGRVDADGNAVRIVPAVEILLSNPMVRDRIREPGGEADIPAIIMSNTADGMCSFTQSLADLVKRDMVTIRVAMEYAPNRDALDAMIKGVQVRAGGMVGRIKAHG
jgi:twitching motility protein PilT